MTSKLGCHWMKYHQDQRDLPHIEAMQYKSFKIFQGHWNNRDACNDLLAVLPRDAYILARDQPLSEQKEDMWRDAQAAGIDHANQWIDKVNSGQYHLPLDRTFFLGINEPDATAGDRNKIDIYTEAFLDRLRVHGLRGGAFNFSTGHPRTVDGTPNTQADYTVFERSHQAIVRGHHIAVLHIYGTGAVPCAPGHYDRLKACTWQDVEWVVGEMGIDEHVIGGGKHIGFHGHFSGQLDDYCAWLDTLILGIDDPRIHSYQVFTYDHASPWETFDIHPIRDALESFTWRHMSATQPTPVPAPQPTTLHVIAQAGLNLRDAPVTGKVLAKLPFGSQVNFIAADGFHPTWFKVRHQATEGYAYSKYLGNAQPTPAPAPEPAPSGDNWQRSMAWVEKWEGEYQNNPADIGNWTGCAVGDGINKGTKYGISACSYPDLDIINLSREQARDIFRRDYWAKSGADAQPWPLCLLMLDTAVLHGVGAATKWLNEVGPNPYAFAAKRLRVYTKSDNWSVFGAGWVNRVADLLEEMAK